MLLHSLMLAVALHQAPAPAIAAPKADEKKKTDYSDILVKSDDFSEEIQKKYIRACPRLMTTLGETGSSVVIAIDRNDAYMLTAFHVVESLADIRAEFYSADNRYDPIKVSDVELKSKSPFTDVALVKVSIASLTAEQRKTISIIPLPKPYDRPKQFPVSAISVGCDFGLAPKNKLETIVAKPLVKRKTDTVGAFFWQMAEAPTQGRSGGPLIDKKGRLLGICVAAKDKVGYFAHLDEIHAQLTKDEFEWLWEKR